MSVAIRLVYDYFGFFLVGIHIAAWRQSRVPSLLLDGGDYTMKSIETIMICGVP